jgi:hypothetical protein
MAHYGDAALGPIDQSLKDALDQIGIIDGTSCCAQTT